MITAFMLDDEKQNRDSLQKLLKSNCPDVELLGEASSVTEALPLIKQQQPQLLFLDIEMPNQSGFDLLRQLDSTNFKIIFITAHAHYAIKAIKFSAIDYLLKPIDLTDLMQAVNKASAEINFNHHAQNKGLLENLEPGVKHKLAVPIRDGLAFLVAEDIIRLEADGTYTHIYSNGEKFTATKNIKEYEDILVEQNFFRSHKSHLINLKHVKKLSRVAGYFVQMSDGSQAEVSRRKQEEFIEMMKRY